MKVLRIGKKKKKKSTWAVLSSYLAFSGHDAKAHGTSVCVCGWVGVVDVNKEKFILCLLLRWCGYHITGLWA